MTAEGIMIEAKAIASKRQASLHAREVYIERAVQIFIAGPIVCGPEDLKGYLCGRKAGYAIIHGKSMQRWLVVRAGF